MYIFLHWNYVIAKFQKFFLIVLFNNILYVVRAQQNKTGEVKQKSKIGGEVKEDNCES